MASATVSEMAGNGTLGTDYPEEGKTKEQPNITTGFEGLHSAFTARSFERSISYKWSGSWNFWYVEESGISGIII